MFVTLLLLVLAAGEEAYLDLLPWQWLAGSNQNFLITERRRHYLRYAGALTFFEINGPSVYKVMGRCCRVAGAYTGGLCCGRVVIQLAW